MKDINLITEVPPALQRFFPSLEVFKAELQLTIDNHRRNGELMAKMLTNMTTVESEAVKAEIHDIAVKMNTMLFERFSSNTLLALAAVPLWCDLMMEYKPDDKHPLSLEQLLMLRASGSFDELLAGKHVKKPNEQES